MPKKKSRHKEAPSAPPAGPVLVPVDFSTHTEATVLWAAEAARCHGTSLLLLHVVHDPGAAPGYYSRIKKQKKFVVRMEEAAAELLDELMEILDGEHAERLDGVTIESRLVVGLPVTRILDIARETDARMIVMGSRGRTGIPHLLLGSKALKVAQLSPIPVTIVKTPS